MQLDRSTLEAAEIPSFDRNRSLGLFTWLYKFHHTLRFKWLQRKTQAIRKPLTQIQLESIEPGFAPLSLSLNVGLVGLK